MVTVYYRIVIAIGKHIIANNAISRRDVYILVYKPTNIRVIISALQIIHTEVSVVVIASVSEWVVLCRACTVVGCAMLTP